MLALENKQGNHHRCSKNLFSIFLLHPNHESSTDLLEYLKACSTPPPQVPEDHKNKLDLQKTEQMQKEKILWV